MNYRSIQRLLARARSWAPSWVRSRPWVRRVVLTLLLVEAAYLLLANLWLATPLSAWTLQRKPEKFLLEWRTGWSVVPGLVHLRDVRLRGQTPAVQWQLELDSARVWCALLPFAVKNFHARHLGVEGLRLALRRRLDPGQEPTPNTPPIDGLSNPPEVPPEELYPRPESKNPWTVALDRVRVEGIRELWIENQRFTGEGHASGWTHFTLRGPFELDAGLTLPSGRLMAGSEPVAEDLALDLEARFDRFTIREHRGLDTLPFLSGRLQVTAEQASFGFLDAYFGKAPWESLAGQGRLAADLGVDRGNLTAGSRLSVEDAHLEVASRSFVAQGEGEVQGAVVEVAGKDTLQLDVEFERFGISPPDQEPGSGETVWIEGKELTLACRTSQLSLSRPPRDLVLTLDLPAARVTRLEALNQFLPPASQLRLTQGEATVRAHLELPTRRPGSGEVHLEGQALGARYGEAAFRGDLGLHLQLVDVELEAPHLGLRDSRLLLRNVDLLQAGGEETGNGQGPWWAEIRIPEGSLAGIEPLDLEARLTAQVQDTRPLVALVAAQKPLLSILQPLLADQDLEASSRVAWNRNAFTLEDLLIDGEKLNARAEVRITSGTPHGRVFFERDPLSVAVVLQGKDRDWKLTGARRWYEEQAPKLLEGR